MRYIDEAGGVTPKMVRAVKRAERRRKAESGWWNWYHDRGHISLQATASDLRRLSWRRAL